MYADHNDNRTLTRLLSILVFFTCSFVTALDHSSPISDWTALSSETAGNDSYDDKQTPPTPDDEGEESELPLEESEFFHRNTCSLVCPLTAEDGGRKRIESVLSIPPDPLSDMPTPPPQG